MFVVTDSGLSVPSVFWSEAASHRWVMCELTLHPNSCTCILAYRVQPYKTAF